MQSEAAFDRALGAWEDAQLNRHLGEGEDWDDAQDRAHGIVWGMSVGDLYEMSTGQITKDIEKSAELMIDMVAEQIMDGQYE